mmetsp:Transcript_2432/g.7099  ORF Transcript_2432/g.7099 Transcript_2432/m.7099 type:complete len:84 (-) Transcript_2432:249-500(-)
MTSRIVSGCRVPRVPLPSSLFSHFAAQATSSSSSLTMKLPGILSRRPWRSSLAMPNTRIERVVVFQARFMVEQFSERRQRDEV